MGKLPDAPGITRITAQAHRPDSEAFRRWFKDSVVVDANGEPLVVWHGQSETDDPFPVFDFDRALDVGMHFGTEQAAEEVIDYVQTRVPGVNRSTIYRTLELLEELGCVFKSEIGGRFIYHHAEEGHHHHLVCRSCGRMIDCEEEVFSPVQKSLEERYGFQADFKHVVVSGICRECREKGSL